MGTPDSKALHVVYRALNLAETTRPIRPEPRILMPTWNLCGVVPVVGATYPDGRVSVVGTGLTGFSVTAGSLHLLLLYLTLISTLVTGVLHRLYQRRESYASLGLNELTL